MGRDPLAHPHLLYLNADAFLSKQMNCGTGGREV
jgi:hypothetical protein